MHPARCTVVTLVGLTLCLGAFAGCERPGATGTPEPSGRQAAGEEPADAGQPMVDVPPEDLKAVVDGNNRFAIELYKKLAETETGNIVFSPYSISSALAMTYAGARGQTADEMAKVLGLTGLGDRAHPAHAALARRLRADGGNDGPAFHVANALWGQQGLPFRPEFLRVTRDNYGAGLREIDFASDTDGARRTINGWVGEQTRGKIPELLKPSHLGPNTRTVLTNALYFKGNWATPFPPAATRDGVFHLDTGEQVTVPFMTQTARLRYAKVGGVEVVELPYEGGALSMVVVLPPKGMPIKWTGTTIDSWLRHANECEVTVSMPRFRVRMGVELNQPLKVLGMSAAFSEAADFSGFAPGGGLQVSCVVHEAHIDVDEKGTEATAATAVDGANSESHRIELRIDHSFYTVLHARHSDTMMFLARVTNP